MRFTPDRGVLFGIAAYTLWGLLPIFWKSLRDVPALEVLCHRSAWSLPFLLIILARQRRLGRLWATLDRRTLLTLLLSASILAVNWYTFIWAIAAGMVVDASLGYFINPLFNVLLGVVVLGEKLRRLQLTSVAIALSGVLYLAIGYGRIPWVALILATTFAFYGLLRKTAPVGSLDGLAIESAWMFVPVVAYLLHLQGRGHGTFIHGGATTSALLIASGAATALPLLLFGLAARRVTMTTLGIAQYIAPSIQFLLGVFLYGEPISGPRVVVFIAVWLALTLFTIDAILFQRGVTSRRAAP